MKSPRPSLRLAVAAFLLPLAAHAQQSPPPVDPAAVLATLKDLKARQTQSVAREKGQVLDAIHAAAADPAKAYEQAYLAVEVQGRGGNEGTKMMDWRKGNADLERGGTRRPAERVSGQPVQQRASADAVVEPDGG